MQRKKCTCLLWIVAVMITLTSIISCHSPKRLGRSPGKEKPAAKDSSATKIDDSPSEFFQ